MNEDSSDFNLSYIVYVKGFAKRVTDFEEYLLSDLARKGVNISNRRPSGAGKALTVKYTDEVGDMTIAVEDTDIVISYTASGGPETLKGAVTGSAAGAGLGVISSVLTGRADREKIISGVAGAITGGAVGAYQGHNKGMREMIGFAKLLAQSVTQMEKKLIEQDRMATHMQAKTNLAQDNLSREKTRLETSLDQLKGQVEAGNMQEESKKANAEARHIEKSAKLEELYAQKKDLLDKLLASENKRYEAEVKQIEANHQRIRTNLSARVSETEKKITMIASKMT